MQKLLAARVRPYYIYQADVVAGAEHFRTAVTKGVEIIRALRGWTSGLGVPHYVIDAPGGGGKIPILPEYVQSVTESEVVLRNYAGEEFRYPLPGSETLPVNGRKGYPDRGIAANGRANGKGNGHGRKNGNGNGKKRESGQPAAQLTLQELTFLDL
jgi:hypothetical protein